MRPTIALLALLPAVVLGQVRPGFGVPEPFLITPVVNEPYSADQVSEVATTLPDGTRVVKAVPNLSLYRDSAGRTRQDGPILSDPAGNRAPIMVLITDPVAGFQYVLDPKRKVAHRRVLVAPNVTPAVASGNPAAASAPLTTDTLGSQWINGVEAQGTRHAAVSAARGGASTEYWVSPELQVTLLRRSVDTHGDEIATRLVNVRRAEPDASLFVIPADYQLVDETATFTILP